MRCAYARKKPPPTNDRALSKYDQEPVEARPEMSRNAFFPPDPIDRKNDKTTVKSVRHSVIALKQSSLQMTANASFLPGGVFCPGRSDSFVL